MIDRLTLPRFCSLISSPHRLKGLDVVMRTKKRFDSSWSCSKYVRTNSSSSLPSSFIHSFIDTDNHVAFV